MKIRLSFKTVLSLITLSYFLLASCSKKNPQPNTSNNNNGGGSQNGGGPNITAAVVSTVSGNPGVMGFENTGALYATFNWPSSIVVDAFGNVFVTDTGNDLIREISASGVVSTFAGTGHVGNANGQSISASFNEPEGIAIDSKGNLFIADEGNNLVRKIAPSGVVSTFAGTGQPGSQDGPPNQATFNAPYAIAIDKLGNVFVSDVNTDLIREIDSLGNVTTIAGTGTFGSKDGLGRSASFNNPVAMALDRTGNNLYVVDETTVLLRKIALDSNKRVTTILNGESTYASIEGIAINANGTIYLSCMSPQIIEENGPMPILVGRLFNTADRDVVTQSSFNFPQGMALNNNGNLLVVDHYNNLIREISPTGQVSNFAGSGGRGSVNGLPAEFYYPSDVAVDTTGDIFVADIDNNAIRKIFPNGSVNTFEYHYGLSLQAPMGVKLDNSGNLFVADRNNNVIRPFLVPWLKNRLQMPRFL